MDAEVAATVEVAVHFRARLKLDSLRHQSQAPALLSRSCNLRRAGSSLSRTSPLKLNLSRVIL